MNILPRLAVLLLSGLLCLGCGQKSGLEGKAVDGKGLPMARIKIIAKPVQPAKGIEEVETSTRDDGSFRLKGLAPGTHYTLFPQDSYWKTEARLTIKSAPAGQTMALPGSLVIRFTSRDGAITDSKTGFQWAADTGQPMNWEQASAYARNLNLSVYSDWRLPTRAELGQLLDKSQPGGIDPIFSLKGVCAWTSEKKDSSYAWVFYFSDGKEDWISQNFSIVQTLTVRSATK
jgi:hypothetical protein